MVRTAALDLLAAALGQYHATVLIISAPAGTGKSVVLADWLDRESRARGDDLVTGWITAHDGLDSATALIAAVHDALGPKTPLPDALSALSGDAPGTRRPRADAPACEVPHRTAPQRRHAPRSHAVPPAGNPAAAPELADLLASLAQARATVLVIDDAHRITAPEALAGLESLLTQAPSHLTVVIAARRAPALGWHRLDLLGRIVRVGARELALNSPRAREVCAQHGYTPDAADLRAIMSLTLGWAALVRLAAAHLAGHDGPPRAALTALARPARAVSDFLGAEVLSDMSPGTTAFLTRTCLPEACTEDLAAALAGPDAAHQLALLEAAGFPFTREVRGDRIWLEHHPLVRAHLLAEARRTHPALLPDLHDRAATWLLAAAEPLRALPHLIAARNDTALRAFLRDNAFALVLDGSGEPLLHALDAASPAVTDDSFVWLLRAVHARSRGEMTEAAAYSALVHARPDAPSLAPIHWLRLLTRAVTLHTDQDAAAVGNGDHELGTDEPPTETGQPDIDCYLALQLAVSRALRGDLADSERALRHCLALASRRGRHRVALRAMTHLSLTAYLNGAITTMRDRADDARYVATRHDLSHTSTADHAAALAALACHWQGTTPDHPIVYTGTPARRDHDMPCSPCDPTLIRHTDSRLLAASPSGDPAQRGCCGSDPAPTPATGDRHKCGRHNCTDARHAIRAREVASVFDDACLSEARPYAAALGGGGEEWGDSVTRVIGWLMAFHAPDAERFPAANGLRDSLSRLLRSEGAAAGGPLLPAAVWALLGVNEAGLAQELVEVGAGALGESADVVVARACIAEVGNRSKSTRALLVSVLDTVAGVHPVTEVTAWLLDASAAERLGHGRRVRPSLERALRRGADEGIIRPFLDVPGVLAMLDEYTGRFGRLDAFADRVRAHPAAGRAQRGPALTKTELAVLRLLPSGRTAQEMSEDLGVSVNTVKTHLRGIYGKLGTNTRGGTLDRARFHGII
ncbi:LuxR C-terminal-related transcriptional regulator [Nocardia sp. NPDC055321]